MDPTSSEFGAKPAMYPNSMVSKSGHMFVPLNPEEQGAHNGLTHHCPSMVDWAPKVADGSITVPSSGGSKALTIRNPKTGEVIGPEKPTNNIGALTLAAKAKWQQEAAKVLARRAGSIKWCADHSTFSALNIDSVMAPAGKSTMNRSIIDGVLKKPVHEKRGDEGIVLMSRGKAFEQGVVSAKGALLLNRKLRQGKKVSATTAATLAALSLEPGLGKHVERGSQFQAAEEMEENLELESGLLRKQTVRSNAK